MNALDYHKPDIITVLGSGWLLDLPLKEMIETTREIILVDIVHPPEVINQVGNLKNVKLLEQDITGGLIEEVWQKAGKYNFFNRLTTLKDINIPEYKSYSDPGLVISLNILTQLEYLLIEFLKQRSKIEEEEFSKFRTEIQKKHVDFLKRHKYILISDYTEVVTDKSGVITTTPTLFTELPEGKQREEWTWKFEQTQAWRYNNTSVMNVVAISI
jgi:hypothetical protein